MATDVCTKAISGNPIRNGSLIQSTQKNGVNMDSDVTYVQANPAQPSDIETRLTNYFDDPNYYSA